MVFGVVSTLNFPVAGSAGSSLWGTDVRKLLDSADGSSDNSTVLNHGTGGAVTRTADPYSTSSADADQTLFGWAIDPADMGSTTDFVRSYEAGDHVLTARMNQNGIAAVNVTVTVFVYRVGPAPTRTRTLLGSNSAVVNLAALGVVATVNVTVALGAVTFAADETIQYSIETNTTGVAITGRTVQFRTGTDGGVAVRVDTPPLKILAATAGTSDDNVGSAAGVLSARADQTGTATGSSTASGVPSAVTSFTGTAAGVSDAVGVLGATGGQTGTAAGSSTAVGVFAAVASMAGTTTSLGSAVGFLTAVGSLIGTAVGTSTAEGVPSSVAGTVGDADGTSTAEGVMGLILGTVGTVDIGGGCPVDWPFNDGARAVAGTVLFHEPPDQGNPVEGATVVLVRDSDGLRVATTTTDVTGAYSFPRDTTDPYTYRVEVTYEDAGIRQQGLSETECAPV